MDSAQWDERYATDDLVWSGEPNRWVRGELEGLAPGRALDLAAGEGRNGLWLATQGWQVTAVDFSRVGLDKAARLVEGSDGGRHAEQMTWIVADIRTWMPDREAFDLVLLSYVQLPRDERVKVLEAALTGLGPGGLLLVIGHDTTNLAEGTGGPQDPAVLFGPDDVLEELPVGNDLLVERAERVRRPVEGDRDAIDVLVRAVRPGRRS